MKDFAGYQRDLIVGVSLQVSAPLGQYDCDSTPNHRSDHEVHEGRMQTGWRPGLSSRSKGTTSRWILEGRPRGDGPDFRRGRRSGEVIAVRPPSLVGPLNSAFCRQRDAPHRRGCRRLTAQHQGTETARYGINVFRRGLMAPHQSRPVQLAPWSRRRLAALERCISSSSASVFSLSRVIFDSGTSVLRSLSSTWPTESLFISAIVKSSARGNLCVFSKIKNHASSNVHDAQAR
jgi:hypothetical protein